MSDPHDPIDRLTNRILKWKTHKARVPDDAALADAEIEKLVTELRELTAKVNAAAKAK